MKRILVFFTLCLLAGSTLAQASLDWYTYKSDPLGFAITFPTSQVQVQPVKVEQKPGSRAEVHLFTGNTSGLLALAGCTDYFLDNLANFSVEKELQLDRDNFLKAVDGKLVSERSFTFGDEKLPALEFTFTMGDYVGKSLVTVKKLPDRYTAYQLVFAFPKTSNNAAAMEKFTDSLKLTARKL